MADAGRPTEYQPEYPDQAYKLCLLGATDQELADFFEVSESTINNWKIAHPEFLESLKKGKRVADTQVADRLYQRALGYEHDDVYITQYQGEILEKDITKHYPPDTTAAIFWLKNRQPAKWRDKTEVKLEADVNNHVDVTDERYRTILEREAGRFKDGGAQQPGELQPDSRPPLPSELAPRPDSPQAGGSVAEGAVRPEGPDHPATPA